MREIANPLALHAKGALFLALGLLSFAALLLDSPRARTALLGATAVWAFCRFYYYAFYVVERYVDPGFRFSGLLSVTRYLLGRWGR